MTGPDRRARLLWATGERRSPDKLGIHEASTVALVGADPEFTIPDLPPGVLLRRSARGRSEVTIWFVRSAAELARAHR